jgi:hypothetical protein
MQGIIMASSVSTLHRIARRYRAAGHFRVRGQPKLYRALFGTVAIALQNALGGQKYITERGLESGWGMLFDLPSLDVLFRRLSEHW